MIHIINCTIKKCNYLNLLLILAFSIKSSIVSASLPKEIKKQNYESVISAITNQKQVLFSKYSAAQSEQQIKLLAESENKFI